MILRAITGTLLIAMTLLCIFAGKPWFLGLWLIFMGVAFKEAFSFQGDRTFKIPYLVCSLIWLLGSVAYLYLSNLWILCFFGAVSVALYFTLAAFILPAQGVDLVRFQSFSTSLALFVYVAVFYTPVLILVGSLERPEFVVLFLFSLFWLQDSFSFLAGKYLGKHPLAPVLSPKKTWEGAVIGLFLTLATLFYFAPEFPPRIGNWILVYGFLVGVSGQVGDLIESGIKRAFQIKDSGAFFPGHGGVLDRFDSVTAGSVVLMGLFLPDLMTTEFLGADF